MVVSPGPMDTTTSLFLSIGHIMEEWRKFFENQNTRKLVRKLEEPEYQEFKCETSLLEMAA